MQDQRNEKELEDNVSAEHRDQAVLHMLFGHSPWSVDEIVRELDGNRLGTSDSIGRLAGAGLVHRVGEFVYPTRAARRMDEIENP